MLKATDSRPVHLLINPRSGYGGRKQLIHDLRGQIRRQGLPLVDYVTRAPADATRYVRQVADEAAAVVVWGGDGTINEVANGLEGKRVPILACPAGTENLLASQVKIPAEPDRIAEILRAGRTVYCDVARMNQRHFLMIAGIGFDGEVVRRLSTQRRGHSSHLAYFWPIWRTLWEHHFPPMRIIADGESIFDGPGLAFVGNIPRYAVGLRIARDAAPDDGLLDLVVFRCRTRRGLVCHSAWTTLRRHVGRPGVLYRQVREVRIETPEPVPTQADGDMAPSTPVSIGLCSERIQLLVPDREHRRSPWPWKGNSCT
ncbi:MAG: diacylglycerol/lipid kinase family protein [Planctomycetota bacterium]